MSEYHDQNTSELELQENLVAYLDGELEPATVAQVETQIANDPQARKEMQRLERVWDALDELPRVEVDSKFTETTVELVAQTAKSEVEQELATLPQQRRWHGLYGLAAITAAFALAFFGTRTLTQNSNHLLLQDLPILQHFDEYQAIENMAFLQGLSDSHLFDEDLSNDTQQTESESVPALETSPVLFWNQTKQLSENELDQRLHYVESLSPAAKDQLRRSSARFQKLTSQEQQRFRDLHQQIAKSKESDRYHHVMMNYYEWFQKQSPTTQRELLSLSLEDRIVKVTQSIRPELSDKDLEGLLAWITERIKQRSSRAPIPTNGSARQRFMATVWMTGGMVINPEILMKMPQDDYEQLLGSLTPETQARLTVTPDKKQQVRLLTSWARSTMYSNWSHYRNRRSGLSYEESLEFYLKLPTADRDRLEALPPQEMFAKLQEKYWSQNQREGFRNFPKFPMGPMGRGDSKRPGGFRDGPNREGSHRGEGPNREGPHRGEGPNHDGNPRTRSNRSFDQQRSDDDRRSRSEDKQNDSTSER